MYSKIIIFLALLYVVNASVITINVFDDDPETEVAHKQRDCNFRACDQLCRRLGFTSGVCVNGRCKCDNFLNNADKVSETAESVSNPHSDSLGDCNFRACDQLCRNLGFTGGACVDGRCNCDNFLYSEGEGLETAKTLSESEDSLSPLACNYRECIKMCRQRGFPSGSCANGRCRCHNYHYTEETTRNCNNTTCNQRCQELGYTDGVCVNSHCKCFSRSLFGVGLKSFFQHGCNYRACNQQCRRLGFTGGVCVDGRCKCDNNFLKTEELGSESAESLSQRDCNFQACKQQCRSFGFPGGACTNNRCKCDIFRKTEGTPRIEKGSSLAYDTTSDKNEEPILALRTKEDELILTPLGFCDTAQCINMCRILNCAGGLCSGGACQCY